MCSLNIVCVTASVRCMLFVMHGIKLFSRVLLISETSEMDLYEVPIVVCLLGFSMGIMFANFHVCGMTLLFSGQACPQQLLKWSRGWT